VLQKQFIAVVLGASGVGKTALTIRFTWETFLGNCDPIIDEGYRKAVTVDGEMCILDLLDTAGTEHSNALNESHIKIGMGFVLVFSLTQEASLREIENVRQQIYKVKGANAKVPIVIVGTKSDLTDERKVQWQTMSNLASQWKLPFYETSAKQGWNVDIVFDELVRQMRLYPGDPARRKRKSVERSGKCAVM